LLPLRQACSWAFYDSTQLEEPDRGDSKESDGDSDVAQPFNKVTDECTICLDVMENPLQTACRHLFCGECIRRLINTDDYSRCPICRTEISEESLVNPPLSQPSLPRISQSLIDEFKKLPLPAEVTQVVMNNKLKVLISHLKSLKEARPSAKALVFTQFTKTLAELQRRLPEQGLTGDVNREHEHESKEKGIRTI